MQYILYAFGKFLSVNNELLEAIGVFRECLRAPLGSHMMRVCFLESLENCKSLVVDRWHFRMLNDFNRNNAYERAIIQAIGRIRSRKGPDARISVLDIGGGTGLLSIYAARYVVYVVESWQI